MNRVLLSAVLVIFSLSSIQVTGYSLTLNSNDDLYKLFSNSSVSRLIKSVDSIINYHKTKFEEVENNIISIAERFMKTKKDGIKDHFGPILSDSGKNRMHHDCVKSVIYEGSQKNYLDRIQNCTGNHLNTGTIYAQEFLNNVEILSEQERLDILSKRISVNTCYEAYRLSKSRVDVENCIARISDEIEAKSRIHIDELMLKLMRQVESVNNELRICGLTINEKERLNDSIRADIDNITYCMNLKKKTNKK